MQIKKILIHLIIIIVLLTLAVFLKSNKPVINQEELDYLNHSNMTIDSNTMDLSLLKTDFLNNQAIIVAELHGVKANYEMKYAFITYLNANSNLNDVLVEVSFSSGYFLNEYIHTGNSKLLDLVFSFYKGSTFWTMEEYQFYQDLYTCNKNLPEEEQINLYGVDIEHSLDSALAYYNYLYQEDIESMDEVINLTTEDKLLIHLINNINYRDVFYSEKINWQFRDTKMYENYLFVQDYYQIHEFYAQFGAEHCFTQVQKDNYKSFAYYLNHDNNSHVYHKVIVIQTFYKNSQRIEATTLKDILFYRKKDLTKTYFTNTLDQIKLNNFTLFKLNQENSPFSQNIIWYYGKNKPEEFVTTDYYQYIIVIKGSSACTPLGKTDKAIDFLISYLKSLF